MGGNTDKFPYLLLILMVVLCQLSHKCIGRWKWQIRHQMIDFIFNTNTAEDIKQRKASFNPGYIHDEVFKVGKSIECYDPSIHPLYSFTARVVATHNHTSATDGISYSYDVKPVFGTKTFRDVQARSVRPLELYTPRSTVMWNYGTELNSKLVPVRIIDHESRSVVIVKSLIDEDDELIKLPISRIRRRIEGV